MKRILLMGALSCTILLAQAQRYAPVPGKGKPHTIDFTAPSTIPSSGSDRAATCSDKVLYVDSQSGTIEDAIIGGVNGWQATFQVFPEFTGKVSKAEIRGSRVVTAAAAEVAVYALNSAWEPTGGPIAIASVTVNTVGNYTATFASPVSVTNGFAIAISGKSQSDSLLLKMNTLGTTYYPTNQYGYYNGSLYNFGSDFNIESDFVVRPTIEFTPVAAGTFIQSTSTTCSGVPISFTNTTNTANYPKHYKNNMFNKGGITYGWTFGDGVSSDNISPTHTYNSAGSYTTEMKVIYNGWSTTCASDPASQATTVNVKPVAGFTYKSNKLQATFTNISSGEPTSYAWNFGDGGTAGAASPIHNYAVAGTYTVELTASNSCGSHLTYANIKVDSMISYVGIDDIDAKLDVHLFPNPATDLLQISYEKTTAEALSFTVIDNVGRVILSETISGTKGATSFNVSTLPAGVYYLQLKSDKYSGVKAFQKL